MLHKLSPRLRPFKNLLIIFLIVLALYQTWQLWIVNITNRNFLSSYFLSMMNPVSSDGHGEFIKPYRIVSGSGDGRFYITYSGLSDSPARTYCENVTAAILKSGEFAAAEPADYKRILARPVYVYEYPFPMPADIFARELGQKTNALTEHDLIAFTAVAVQPPIPEDGTLRIFFISGETAFEFYLDENNRQEPSARYAHEIIPATEEGTVYYVSAALEDMNGVAPGLFIAQWDGALRYRPVTITNPYVNSYGEKLLSFIQNRVEPFFDNPSAMKPGAGTDGVYTFSSVNTVVRYYKSDILEYANYRSLDRNAASGLITDYAAALTFLQADTVNEFYLADYRFDGDKTLLYFDYVINDLPLVMPEGWPSASESGHPLEVTVDHGVVVKYKKLVYHFHIDENASLRGSVDFNSMLDRLSISGDGAKINELLLGYRIENKNRLSIHWFYETTDEKRMQGLGS